MIIGGFCDGIGSSHIAKYTLDEWELVGNLQRGRQGHRAISNGDRIFVVGGYSASGDNTYRYEINHFLDLLFFLFKVLKYGH